MRAGGNFIKRDHETFITKINFLVIFNVFTNLDEIQVEAVRLSSMRALMLNY